MDQQTSSYQALKLWLAEYLPVDRDILHVLIGLSLVIIAMFASRKQGSIQPFFWALVLACVLGIGMEILDMRDDIRALGGWRWRASVLDFSRTICAPLVALLAVLRLKRT